MLYEEKFAVCSEVHYKTCTGKVITMQNSWLLNLVVRKVTGRL